MYNATQFHTREYAIGSLANRHNFNLSDSSIFHSSKGSTECYCSHFLHSEELAKYFNAHSDENGKCHTKGYSGAVSVDEFIIDIDSEDLNEALSSIRKLLKVLEEKFELDLNYVKVNFSGSKGFHLRLHENLFGGFAPSENLPNVIKIIAKEISSGVITIDESIYDRTRLIRIPNSINKKSGLVAIPLTVDEVFSLTIEEIKEMAQKPRDVTCCDVEDMEECESLVELKNKALSSSIKSISKALEVGTSGKQNKIWASATEGNRHSGMAKIVGHLIKHSLPDYSIKEIVKNWNAQNTPPKEVNVLLKEVEHVLKTYNSIKGDYWTISRDSDGETSAELDMLEYINFLETKGFSKVYLDRGYVFIKTDNNIITETSLPKIKDFVLDDIRTKEGLLEAYKALLLSKIISKSGYYVGTNLIECVKPTELKIKKDNKTSAEFYYQNGVVKFSKENGIEISDYSTLDGSIWGSQILQRDFKLNQLEKSVFEQFLFNVAGQSEERLNTVKSAIGYLLHGYKDSANAKVIVLCDEKIPENQEPNGRTGKSLLGKAISQMKNSVRMDGKNFSFDKSFAFQQVKLDTDIMEFNDVKRDFDFERLFSVATDSMTVEKKNKDEFTIPFERSPKIIVSTNYTLKGTGDSFKARLFEIEFSDYYNARHQPKDDFHKMFFDEWDKEEWNKFDNFMLGCVEFYLRNGLINHTPINLERRKLIDNTSREFVEFAESGGLALNTEFDKHDLHWKFTRHYQDFSQLKQRTFTVWVRRYAIYKGLNYSERKSNGKDLALISNGKTQEQEFKEAKYVGSTDTSYLFN